MKMPYPKFQMISFLMLFIFACHDAPDVVDSDSLDGSISVIDIPDGFDYSTHYDVRVTINDNSDYAKYDVFAYSSDYYLSGNETFENEFGEIVTEPVYKNDVMEKLVFSGVPANGVLTQLISIPNYCDQLYIRRNESLKYSASKEYIVNNEVNYSYVPTFNRGITGDLVNDYLYCVNGSGELSQVDPLSGELTDISTMPMGSWTCAIDQENKTLYSIGKSSPYPLMKYSILDSSWETVGSVGLGGPRLDYRDGLLYFSNLDKLYTINPLTASIISTKTINGLHDTSGGDLAFADDGTLFLCTFSGLYELELDANDEYQSTRISSDNLPFLPTSMTFDSNQELWLASNGSSSDLIVMDTQTGGWQYQYGENANNNTGFGRTINDLTTFRVYSVNNDTTDTDGDGILDQDDAYPEDENIAFESFTPSKYGKGTIAFEDLWPSTGDYDFNDAALSYQVILYLNSDNMAVQLDFVCNIKANGAGYINGIGFEIEGLAPSQIESISGPVLTRNYINLNSNGTESNQDNAVIIIADDVDNILNETTIAVKFVSPISTSDLGVAPYNPFIIVNEEREKEIHLPYMSTTNLGTFNGSNNDPDGDFISDNGFPWAISIVHDFKVPSESVNITEAYNFFVTWAESGGTDVQDWYKDNPGNRNTNLIQD